MRNRVFYHKKYNNNSSVRIHWTIHNKSIHNQIMPKNKIIQEILKSSTENRTLNETEYIDVDSVVICIGTYYNLKKK